MGLLNELNSEIFVEPVGANDQVIKAKTYTLSFDLSLAYELSSVANVHFTPKNYPTIQVVLKSVLFFIKQIHCQSESSWLGNI